jgi:nucleoside-diphosphate-sugar epimerase
MKKVLVTGATGFLGSYILKELRGRYDIICVGRNAERLNELTKEDYTLSCIKADLSDIKEVEKFPKTDIVVHSAALSTVWGSKGEFVKNNITATENIIKYCKQKKIKRMVYISTPSVYSEKRDRFNVKEDDFNKDNRLNYYIETKIAAEKIVLESKSSDFEVVVIRPKGLIGIGDTSILPRLIQANEKIGIPVFKGREEILVDMTSVENAAYSILLCMEKEGISGEVFNITNGEPTYQQKLLEYLSESLGTEFRYKKLSFGKVYAIASILEYIYSFLKIKKEPLLTRYTVCTLAFSQTLDIEKAGKLLGYKPRISLEDEIKRFGKFYKENSIK